MKIPKTATLPFQITTSSTVQITRESFENTKETIGRGFITDEKGSKIFTKELDEAADRIREQKTTDGLLRE